MDETRKRYLTAGIIVGSVAVGLTVLAKRTPRDQWGPTLHRVLKDVLSVVKFRYGSNEAVTLAEKAIDRFQDSGTEHTA